MKRNIIVVVLIISSFWGYGQEVHNLTLKVTNIQKVVGDISIALFDNGDEFPGHANCYIGINLPVSSNELTYVFKDIPSGTYAIALYHDIDKNGELNANWIGIPREPYGFSNDAMGTMGPPKFEDAGFVVKSNMETIINLKN